MINMYRYVWLCDRYVWKDDRYIFNDKKCMDIDYDGIEIFMDRWYYACIHLYIYNTERHTHHGYTTLYYNTCTTYLSIQHHSL